MATLQETKMQAWRIRNANLYRNEFEQKLYGALDFYLQQTEFGGLASPELRQRVLGSTGNTIQVPVLKSNTAAEVGSERSCVNPNNETDSTLVGLTFVTLVDGFTIVPNRYMNNDITEKQHFDANMMDMVRRLAIELDKLCLANLNDNKTAVIGDPLNYTVSGQTVNAKWGDRMDVIGDLNAMMVSNAQYGRINLVGNMGSLNLLNKLAEHDIYNAVNKRYEYADKTLWLTHQLANAEGKYATMFAVPDGQVALLSRVSRAEYRGSRANEHAWGTTTLPFMGGLTFGTHFYTTVGDQSTLTGEGDMICDYAEHYTFSIDVAFLNSYVQDAATMATPIIKLDMENGENGVYLVKNVG